MSCRKSHIGPVARDGVGRGTGTDRGLAADVSNAQRSVHSVCWMERGAFAPVAFCSAFDTSWERVAATTDSAVCLNSLRQPAPPQT